MIETGAKAPAFQLPDQDGNPVSLAKLRGEWVVLYFYPRDDTPGCTVEACEFTAAMPDFGRLGARVFGCSGDSASAHLKFIAKHRLGITLLTDADHGVMTAFGAYGEKVMYGKKVKGVIRSTVLIDPQGRVAHHWPKVKAAGHAAAVQQRLAELQGGALVMVEKPARKVAAKAAPAKAAKAAKAASVSKSAPRARKAAKKAQKK